MSRVYVDVVDSYVDYVVRGAGAYGLRTGQYLFNHLPEGACCVVSGTLFDPFHKELTPRELKTWIDNHLIFNHNRIIAVFDGDNLLWEEAPDESQM